jgi:hypothetical protein
MLFLFFLSTTLFAETAQQNIEETFSGAFSTYADFQRGDEEQKDAFFNQFGRFCGIGVGLGTDFVTGNRGKLWQGGFPTFNFQVHYWFNFHVALHLGLMTSQHYYTSKLSGITGKTTVSLSNLGVGLRYYLDTKDLNAPLTFSSPFFSATGSLYYKTENAILAATTTNDAAMGFALGAGFEFPINPLKTYTNIEAKIHFVTFLDTYSALYQSVDIPDLTGYMITLTGSILFTW